MAVATFGQLRSSGGTISEGMIKTAKSPSRKNLFLSHSRFDVDHVGPALGLLEDHGARVYVDALDTALATLSERGVAERLRKAIRSCERLVVLATEQTPSSRWIPWELGVADGRHGREQAALLPLRAHASAGQTWARQGYFRLYPRIEVLEDTPAPRWVVFDPEDDRYWHLADWLTLQAR